MGVDRVLFNPAFRYDSKKAWASTSVLHGTTVTNLDGIIIAAAMMRLRAAFQLLAPPADAALAHAPAG